jgi:hypothetical protein
VTSIDHVLQVMTRVFLPVTALLAGLGIVFVDLPAGFTTAVAALGGFAACLVAGDRHRLRRPGRLARRSRLLLH